MSRGEELVLPLKAGMRDDLNIVDIGGVEFRLLENLFAQDDRLIVEPYFVPYACLSGGGLSDNYVISFNVVGKKQLFGVKIEKSLYALSEDVPISNLNNPEYIIPLVKVGDFVGIDGTTNFAEYDQGIMQSVTWTYGNVSTAYMTRLGLPLHKIVDTPSVNASYSLAKVNPTFVEDGETHHLSAKYMLVTNNRLFLGNCYVDTVQYPTRVHWSDINNPEDFKISDTSEADFTYLGINSLEITGLAYTNGVVLIFTRNSIWRSDYEGHDLKFRTTIFSSNVGNYFHYGCITVNEIVYFVGRDNFYKIDGLTISPIGDPIWEWFKQNSVSDVDSNVIAQYEMDQKSITWVFTRKYNTGDRLYGIKYNIVEGTWTTRDMQVI